MWTKIDSNTLIQTQTVNFCTCDNDILDATHVSYVFLSLKLLSVETGTGCDSALERVALSLKHAFWSTKIDPHK